MCNVYAPPGVLLREVLGARVVREAGVQRERAGARARRRHVHFARLARLADYTAHIQYNICLNYT